MPFPVSTWVEVDLDRFAANLREIRGLIGPDREILLVAKADGYGHGAREIAAEAAEQGATRVGVATLHEGLQLRQAGLALPIVVLSPLVPAEIDEAVAHDLEPTVCDLDFARRLSDVALRRGRPVRCHVEIDTGMGRIGVREEDAEAFFAALAEMRGLRVASAYTHFPDAEAADLAFARGQVERLLALMGRLEARGLRPPRLHAANSAGTLNVPEARFDWVRVGLVAYGHHPSRDDARPAVAPVMSLRSRLVQVRSLPAGTSVSYSRTFVTSRPSRIGVVPVGYGHGYSWLLSNRGAMLVRGQRAPIVGRVTMDLTMIDLTDHPADIAVGEEVVLFGEQRGASLPVDEVARWSETLPYEILCTIGKRVARVYRKNGVAVHMTTLVGERPEWTAAAAAYVRQRDAEERVGAAGARGGRA